METEKINQETEETAEELVEELTPEVIVESQQEDVPILEEDIVPEETQVEEPLQPEEKPKGFIKRLFTGNSETPKEDNKDKPKRGYRKKENLKRFYTPQEWFRLLAQIKNEKHKFLIEFLLHTGARINEARGVRITDIDFDREQIILRKTKGGIKKNRTIQISTYLTGRIKSYMSSKKIESKLDTLNFPSTVMMDKMIKRYTMLAGIQDWQDFSNHNIRKSTENFLIGLNINHLAIQAHMGHTLEVAAAHYVANQLLNAEDKSLIRAILDNLLQK
jgi:integrase